jgi:hypothetical protein
MSLYCRWVDDGGRWKSQRVQARRGWWVINALKFGYIWQRQPLLFLLTRERSIPSPAFETSYSRKRGSRAGSAQRRCWE